MFRAGSISNIDDTDYKCHDGSVPQVRNKVISGVVGASSSVTSIQVANLLRLFKIPQVLFWFSLLYRALHSNLNHCLKKKQVSFFSSSPELKNKQRFEFFTRTIPSDDHQATAIAEMLVHLKWSYVSILYEESTYGIKVQSISNRRADKKKFAPILNSGAIYHTRTCDVNQTANFCGDTIKAPSKITVERHN